MRGPRSYFVFNKESDFRRGWQDNITCLGSGIRLTDPGRPGVLWTRLLDSREKETVWHRLTMKCESPGAACVKFSFYCGEEDAVDYDGRRQSIGAFLRDPAYGDDDRLQALSPWLRATDTQPEDVLLHGLKGRFLWMRIELTGQAGVSPELGSMMLRFPAESWTDYLPEIYREGENSFTDRFLGLFQTLFTDLDEKIVSVARYLDPEAVDGEYLSWLADWLDVEDGYLWPEDKLRQLVIHGMELYRIRGTRRYMIEMVKLYTGCEPMVVEQSQLEPFFADARRGQLLKELYGDSPHMVTLVLDGAALESVDAHRALLRIIENAKPAWTEVNLVVLTPYLFLDKYSYLGINSRLDRYQQLNLSGSSAVPFATLGNDSDPLISI